MSSQLQSFHSKHAGKEGKHTGREETKTAPQQSLRSYFWMRVWTDPLIFLLFCFVIIFPLFLFLNTFPSEERQLDVSTIFYFLLVAYVIACIGATTELIKKGIGFKCACGQYYDVYTPWACGYCQEANILNHPYHRPYKHLFRSCTKCGSIPLGLLCISCNRILHLTQWAIDLYRYARVYGAVYPGQQVAEHPEIAELRRQQEIERVRRQYQEEAEREKLQARAKQMSSDLEILPEKIKFTKQFEKKALNMVKDLKGEGELDAYEERVLLEMIKDKVLEEFHVDRRGGRSQY